MANHIIECTEDEQGGLLNTGAKDQCLTAPVVKYTLATNDQEFADKTKAKDLAEWNKDIADKKLYPLFEVEELAIADTEDTNWEGRNSYLTKRGQKIRTGSMMLGECSHAALASFHGKIMKVYEHTSAQELKAVTPDGIKVKGQTVKIEVMKMVDALDDKPQHTPIRLIYQDHQEYEKRPVKLKVPFSHLDLNGIFDVEIEQVSASATSVKFTVDAGCAGDRVVSLEAADIEVLKADGTAQTHTFVEADENGVYEIIGTGFATGMTIGLVGVVTKTDTHYENIAVLVVTITP